MSRFNTLYIGEPADAAQELEDAEAWNDDLRIALINALNRIHQLTRRVEQMDKVLMQHLRNVE